MAYVTYTTTTPVTHVSLPLLYPCVLISPVAIVGKERPSRTHSSAFSSTAEKSQPKLSHGAPVPLSTTTLRTQAVSPAVSIAPRGYCVCVSPYQPLFVLSPCVPPGYVIREASRSREMKDKAETSRQSSAPGGAVKPVHLTKGTEALHNCRPSTTKRDSQQSHVSTYLRGSSPDDKHRFSTQKPAAQRTPTVRSRSGRDLLRELGSAAKKKGAAYLFGTNAERPQNGQSFYSSEVPKRTERKLRNGGFREKAAKTTVPRHRDWVLEGQLDVDGTVELI